MGLKIVHKLNYLSLLWWCLHRCTFVSMWNNNLFRKPWGGVIVDGLTRYYMNSKKCKFGNSLMKQSEPRKPSILEFWIWAFFCCTIIESMKFLRSLVNLTLSSYSSTHMLVFLTQRLGLRGYSVQCFWRKL